MLRTANLPRAPAKHASSGSSGIRTRGYAVDYLRPTELRVEEPPTVTNKAPLLRWLTRATLIPRLRASLDKAPPNSALSLRKMGLDMFEKFDSARPLLGRAPGISRLEESLGADFVEALGKYAAPFAANDLPLFRARQAVVAGTLAKHGLGVEPDVTGYRHPAQKVLSIDKAEQGGEEGYLVRSLGKIGDDSSIMPHRTAYRDAKLRVARAEMLLQAGLIDASLLKEAEQELANTPPDTLDSLMGAATPTADQLRDVTELPALLNELSSGFVEPLVEITKRGLERLHAELSALPEYERAERAVQLAENDSEIQLATLFAAYAATADRIKETEESLEYLARTDSELGRNAKALLEARAKAAPQLAKLEALDAADARDAAAIELVENDSAVRKVAELEAVMFGSPVVTGEARHILRLELLALNHELYELFLKNTLTQEQAEARAKHLDEIANKSTDQLTDADLERVGEERMPPVDTIPAAFLNTPAAKSLLEYGRALELAINALEVDTLMEHPGTNLSDLLAASLVFPDSKPDPVQRELSALFNDREAYNYNAAEEVHELSAEAFTNALGAGEVHPSVLKQLLAPYSERLAKVADQSPEGVEQIMADILTSMWIHCERFHDGPAIYKVLLPLVPHLRRVLRGDYSSVDFHLNKSPMQFLRELKFRELCDKLGLSNVQRLNVAKTIELSGGSFTLEWTLPSPPPEHTYEEMPIIKELPDVVPEVEEEAADN